MVEVRAATDDDLHEIAEVSQTGWRNAYSDLVTADAIDDFLQRWGSPDALTRRMAEGSIDVAVAEGRVVGFLQHGAFDSATYEVYALYVRPETIGSGVGWALWQRANRAATERRAKAIELWVLDRNRLGIDWYIRQGGVEVGQRTVKLLDGEHRLLRYRFTLTPGA